MKAAVLDTPRAAGIDLANWNWKGVRLFVDQHFGRTLCRSSCVNYLYRLGFVLKRPKKRLLKANAELRDAFVAAYAKLRTEAQSTGARIFFVDEAHFRADADLRAKWVLRVKHTEPLIVIWDNSPAHRGPEIRAYVATPDLKLRLVALPA